jgi:hypothetical protein
MLELFNPAGLRMLEDRNGAVAYGYLAPRVLYARVVGCLSAELGQTYVQELNDATRRGGPLAYFADESALSTAHPLARKRFRAFVAAERCRFTSIVMLSWGPGGATAARGSVERALGPIEFVDEPIEFERALCNVTTFPDRRAKDFANLWQLHTPCWLPSAESVG